MWIIWSLRDSAAQNAARTKKGLALAVCWGAFTSLASVLLVLAVQGACERKMVHMVLAVLVSTSQVSLVGAAIKSYYSMARAAGDWRILLTRLSVPVVIALFLAIAIPHLVESQIARNEAFAMGALRSIGTAEEAYAKAHPEQGFAPSLKTLSLSPGTGMLSTTMASGASHDYTFTLVTDKPGTDGLMHKYTAVARPSRYPKCGIRSFFVDETGVFRYTAEDRAATAQDSPLL